MGFYEALKEQRWDDHRYYHRSRINQSLHFVSALSFLTAYAMIFINPIIAVFLGWFVAMGTRQAGHFFFEPKDYDDVNEATHEYKESIKVGYNLKRKIVLIAAWLLSPVILYLDSSLFGLLTPAVDTYGYVYNLSILWLLLGGAAIVFRTVHLFFIQDVQTGLVWATKIFTDPFHDVKIYYKSPFYLLKGQTLDPMTKW